MNWFRRKITQKLHGSSVEIYATLSLRFQERFRDSGTYWEGGHLNPVCSAAARDTVFSLILSFQHLRPFVGISCMQV